MALGNGWWMTAAFVVGGGGEEEGSGEPRRVVSTASAMALATIVNVLSRRLDGSWCGELSASMTLR